MNDLLINKLTKLQLQSLAQNPPHAILFVGSSGIGKLTLAQAWAAELCKTTEFVGPSEKGSITIEVVRSLYRKTSGKQTEQQIIIVDHAETMSIEAQNAFLKLLEEPRKNVTFILTTPSLGMILQTIISRVQVVNIGLVSARDLKDWALKLKPDLNVQEIAQLLFIAQGRPAILRKVLNDNEVWEQHKTIMQTAKRLISDPTYDRLTSVNELAKDRGNLIATLEAMTTMTSMQLLKAPSERWLKLADSLDECLSSLAQNGNARAQLVNLFLSY